MGSPPLVGQPRFRNIQPARKALSARPFIRLSNERHMLPSCRRWRPHLYLLYLLVVQRRRSDCSDDKLRWPRNDDQNLRLTPMPSDPKELAEYKTDHDLLVELRTLFGVMIKKVDDMGSNFVTQDQFWPVKTLVYGCTGIMLTSLVGAVIYLVIK
jgi:hypothetical protein